MNEFRTNTNGVFIGVGGSLYGSSTKQVLERKRNELIKQRDAVAAEVKNREAVVRNAECSARAYTYCTPSHERLHADAFTQLKKLEALHKCRGDLIRETERTLLDLTDAHWLAPILHAALQTWRAEQAVDVAAHNVAQSKLDDADKRLRVHLVNRAAAESTLTQERAALAGDLERLARLEAQISAVNTTLGLL